MRKKSLIFPILLILSLAIFSACQKEGSEGPPGPAGQQGPAGPQGPKGDSGTANVIFSEWLSVEFAPNEDSTNWIAEIFVPALTNEILSEGEIKVYINFNTAEDPFVFPLPFFDGADIINPLFFTDTIALISTLDASTQLTDDGDEVFQYRYVIIPGGVLARKPESIDFNNYLELKNYFKLND